MKPQDLGGCKFSKPKANEVSWLQTNSYRAVHRMPVRGELRQVCPASQRLLVGPRVWWRSVVGYLRVRVGKRGQPA